VRGGGGGKEGGGGTCSVLCIRGVPHRHSCLHDKLGEGRMAWAIMCVPMLLGIRLLPSLRGLVQFTP